MSAGTDTDVVAGFEAQRSSGAGLTTSPFGGAVNVALNSLDPLRLATKEVPQYEVNVGEIAEEVTAKAAPPPAGMVRADGEKLKVKSGSI